MPRSHPGGETNTMPSDFVILAIFRDKRNQCALYIAVWRPFTRQIEGIHRAFAAIFASLLRWFCQIKTMWGS